MIAGSLVHAWVTNCTIHSHDHGGSTKPDTDYSLQVNTLQLSITHYKDSEMHLH
jgi:hypothetical protein